MAAGYRARDRATEVAAAVVVVAAVSPLLAVPVGLALRVVRWAAGL